MKTSYANSSDGIRIAYDRSGKGPAMVILHGGGSSRKEWHHAKYVDRLKENFTVLTMDLRGHGESDMPTDPIDYTIEKMLQDILAVADACKVDQFALWGMSYGGKIGRYLAVQSNRVTKLALMGTPLGLGVCGEQRQEAIDFCAHWSPIKRALKNGAMDITCLTQQDRKLLKRLNVGAMLGWVKAMLNWGSVEPADFLCPTLWLVGSEDRHAITNVRKYRKALKGSKVQVVILEGLNHEQVFEEIDRTLPILLDFSNKLE